MTAPGMAGGKLLLATSWGHEACVKGTEEPKQHEYKIYLRRVGPPHVDGANPFSFLLCAECSPFSAYSRLRAGLRITGARRGDHRPKDDQGDRKESEDEHC